MIIFFRVHVSWQPKRGNIMKQKKIGLACSVCGSRNYSKTVGAKVRTERLEIKKYCKYCGEHTLHKETK